MSEPDSQSRHDRLRRRDPGAPGGWRDTLKAVLVITALLAVMAGGYTVYWFAMADKMRVAADDWRDQQAARGLDVAWESFRISGFPLWMRADVTGARLGRPADAAPWRWEVATAVARARPWDFRHVTVDLAGDHALALTVDGRAQTFAGAAETMIGVLDIDGGGEWSLQADIADLALAEAEGGDSVGVANASLNLRRVPRSEPGHLDPTWFLTLDGADIRLPDRLPLVLGPRIANVSVDARLLGTLPTGPAEASLAAWRDAGGTVEATRLDGEWGPLTLGGDGTVALDGGLQPIGSFTVKVQGFFALLDMLRRQGLIDGSVATTATVVLGALARRPEGGGPPTLSLPVSIQAQTVYAGPVAIARIPDVRWGGLIPNF